MFLAFLLFAVQLMVDEYAMTATTSAAFDGARIVAGSRVDQTDRAAVASARQQAETRMRHELGLGHVDRTVRVRIERWR